MTAPESKEARLAAALAEYEKVCDTASAEYLRKRRAIEAEP